MMKKELSYLITILAIFTVSFAFIGGDCSTDDDPDVIGGVAPPANLQLSIDALPGGNSFAVLSWDSSPDASSSDFRGYRIATFIADEDGNVDSLFDAAQVTKDTRTFTVSSISRGTRYKTFVSSELNDGRRSDSVETLVYGGVFLNEGMIDEFMISGSAESGFGWDPVTGNGSQYSYVAENTDLIDLHLRRSNNQLTFYSPALQSPGTKTTLFRLIGTGTDAFNSTELEEPALDSIAVNNDEVYLIKTADDIYIKVWVQEIASVNETPAFDRAAFEYKVQPIAGLRVLKR